MMTFFIKNTLHYIIQLSSKFFRAQSIMMMIESSIKVALFVMHKKALSRHKLGKLSIYENDNVGHKGDPKEQAFR